ncbi:polyprenol monophosphomannose synthase [Chondrinema litorale]|uniref:polyprenol monophosphomannose synthase n=1 Tax=Chondrinema litorale TaxID=2994555 RepID=UPI002542FBBD|nr:polyprenol monophosphomannose synthase [Chondrinema litorale]UZR93746.1 polyprenol monophosphomannose synthase [Chondrinema litorale]
MSKQIVIIPTYNEIENIEGIISEILSLYIDIHILIVDDGSPDGTADKVKEMQKQFDGLIYMIEREKKSGLGTAYITGFKYALAKGYDYIFEMDADFSHNPRDLVRLFEACKNQGFDVAVGSRYITGVNVVNWPMSRVIMSYFASKYVKFITGMPISDATAGFKCYSRKVLEKIDLDRIRFVGYAFQIEMKFKAWKYNFQIKEVPIIFTDRTKGTSKMSTKIFAEAFFGVVRLKIMSFFQDFV